ncbi:MAG TPA: HNH endonuclease [Thermoleophilia bacterium]|nr:HNH endonuclease [Thermoleophilia bacterium]
MRRINLLRAHGSPTGHLYSKGCRCVACRGAKRQLDRRYQAAHREQHVEASRRYNAAHREVVNERCRRYSAAHREEIAERGRRYRKANRDYVVEYRAAHRDEAVACNRRYRAAHRDEYQAYARNRKARNLAAPGTHTADDVQEQHERQRGRCFWCHEKLTEYHVDHVIPLAGGGGNGIENIVVSCPRCNLSKGAKHPTDWAGVLC